MANRSGLFVGLGAVSTPLDDLEVELVDAEGESFNVNADGEITTADQTVRELLGSIIAELRAIRLLLAAETSQDFGETE